MQAPSAHPRRARTTALLALMLAASLFGSVKDARAEPAPIAAGASIGRALPGSRVGASVLTDAGISTEADHLTGRAVRLVCAQNTQGWLQALAEVGFPPVDGDEYYGFSLIEQGEIHLSPYVCEGLRLGMVASRRRSHELQVAWSVDVLIHESVHLARSTVDEALTEACARLGLPAELHRLYRVAYDSAEMRRLTSAATFFRRTEAPEYQGGSCSALPASGDEIG
jgi:hypothetical protein